MVWLRRPVVLANNHESGCYGRNAMNEAARPESSRTVLIALLAVCLIAVAAVLFLVLRPEPAPPETVVEVVEAAAPAEVQLHVAQVVDTLANPGAVAEEGARYKVLIVDEAREGASGIAKIGGLVTFVPETRRGDLVVIEVSRLKHSTADARLIERLASGQPVPPRETGSRPGGGEGRRDLYHRYPGPAQPRRGRRGSNLRATSGGDAAPPPRWNRVTAATAAPRPCRGTSPPGRPGRRRCRLARRVRPG
jgi:predicted RNA-binding protein with TRAM domain